jgi:hypothetical protein
LTEIRKLLDRMFKGFVAEQFERDLKGSLFMQDNHARRFRVDMVIGLSVEYQRVSSINIFSSAFGRAAIEYVMLGDWKRAKEYADMLRFNDEDFDGRERYQELWQTFVTMVDSVCDEAKRIEAGAEHHRDRN